MRTTPNILWVRWRIPTREADRKEENRSAKHDRRGGGRAQIDRPNRTPGLRGAEDRRNELGLRRDVGIASEQELDAAGIDRHELSVGILTDRAGLDAGVAQDKAVGEQLAQGRRIRGTAGVAQFAGMEHDLQRRRAGAAALQDAAVAVDR